MKWFEGKNGSNRAFIKGAIRLLRNKVNKNKTKNLLDCFKLSKNFIPK